MSSYSYAGNFENPADSFNAIEITDGPNAGKFYIAIAENTGNGDGSIELRPHTMHGDNLDQSLFDDWDSADEWIEGTAQRFEEDYEQYLEENHDELARMDEYEQWRNEY